jgi:hypothetical protein
MEDRKKPTVTLVNKGFFNDALSAASSKGMPGLRVVSENVQSEASVLEDIDTGLNGAIDSIVMSLTKPLTAEEESPQPKKTEKPPRLIFQGTLEETDRFFYKRGWTDGLPVIPPTEEAVAEMLTGTDLRPDYLLGKLIPRQGKVTVEKIAINAVMAGALPTYMPVLIAGAKLLLESEPGFYGFTTYGFSTGSWAPFWLINGPIRNDIRINFSSGGLSPGDRANAAIGRAMGLIIKNLGGIRKGMEDMGVQGNPAKYTCVLAENEEESPWEPLHMEYGYKKEDSTVTVAYPNSYVQHWPFNSDDEGIMRSIIAYLLKAQRYNIILPPIHAKVLGRQGWTKKDIKKFIADYARVPATLYNLQAQNLAAVNPNEKISHSLYNGKIPAREWDMVPVVRDPEFIKIIVAGGPGAFIGQLIGGGPTPGRKATQKIELPANWDKLVAKYKDVVPTYAKY